MINNLPVQSRGSRLAYQNSLHQNQRILSRTFSEGVSDYDRNKSNHHYSNQQSTIRKEAAPVHENFDNHVNHKGGTTLVKQENWNLNAFDANITGTSSRASSTDSDVRFEIFKHKP